MRINIINDFDFNNKFAWFVTTGTYTLLNKLLVNQNLFQQIKISNFILIWSERMMITTRS